ncbi:MAG: hypothetical protein HRU33_12295 [Rhodobacteraceae bacterium]|nr:hypothetical protein [Paracoccaceae bacterium]
MDSFPNIGKATLVAPPMEAPSLNLESILASGIKEFAGNHIWNAFRQRSRIQKNLNAGVMEEAFWHEISQLLDTLGADPILLVNDATEGQALHQLRYDAQKYLPKLKMEWDDSFEPMAPYICTIEGVDVFSAGLNPGHSWLFSAQYLKLVQYPRIKDSESCLDLTFDPGENMKGTLHARFLQHLEWSDAPVFELKTPVLSHEETTEID